MKKLWARVGITFRISEEEYSSFKAAVADKNNIAKKLVMGWIAKSQVFLDGETYFPDSFCCSENPNNEEYGVCLYEENPLVIQSKDTSVELTQQIILREVNVNGCGGNAEISVFFHQSLTSKEEKLLTSLVKEFKVLCQENDEDAETNTIVELALARFKEKTGKDYSDGGISVIEF